MGSPVPGGGGGCHIGGFVRERKQNPKALSRDLRAFSSVERDRV